MVHAGCVFVADIHPSRTWTSGSCESVRWNACVHRVDLGLYSLTKEFRGNGVRAHVNSKGKIPLPENFSPEESRTHDAASSRTKSPTHYKWAILFRNAVSYWRKKNLAVWQCSFTMEEKERCGTEMFCHSRGQICLRENLITRQSSSTMDERFYCKSKRCL